MGHTMLQRLREWFIQALGGVTQGEHDLECRECTAIGRFEAHSQNVAQFIRMQHELRRIGADLDLELPLRMPAEPPQRMH